MGFQDTLESFGDIRSENEGVDVAGRYDKIYKENANREPPLPRHINPIFTEPVKAVVQKGIEEFGPPVKNAVIKGAVVGGITGASFLGGGKMNHDEGYIDYSRLLPAHSHSQGIRIYENPDKVTHPQESKHAQRAGTEIDPSLSLEENVTKNMTEIALRAVPDKPKLRENAKVAIPLIIKALRAEGYTSDEVLAYALATAEWESKFNPGLEIDAASQAEANNYHGGERYAGRGYIQLTGKMNYKEIGDYLGIDLVGNPELAEQPENAARILAAYFKLHKTAMYAEDERYIEARRTVNGGEFKSDDPDVYSKPYDIAETAQLYLALLKGWIVAVCGLDQHDNHLLATQIAQILRNLYPLK